MGQVAGLTGELNFITSYWWNGCRTPFNLMIETAREPAGIVALCLLDIGFDDIIRSFTRPGGKGGHRPTGKTRGQKRSRFQGIPEISDLIAHRIDGTEGFRAREVQQGVRALWKIDGWLQATTWNVVVVELSTDFVYASLLGVLKLKATKCDVPGRGYIEGHDFDPFNNGAYFALPFQNPVYTEYPVTANPLTLFIDDGNYYQVLSSMLCTNPTADDGDVQWELRVAAAEGGGIYQSAVHSVPAGATVSEFFAAIIKGPGFIQLYQRSHADVIFPNHYVTVFPSMFTT